MRDMRKGFSFIEVMAAALILSMIGVAIAGAFMAGARVWKRARSLGASRMSVFVFLTEVEQTIRRSCSVRNFTFSGTEHELSLPGLRGDVPVQITYTFVPRDTRVVKQQAALHEAAGGDSARGAYPVVHADDVLFEYLVYNATEHAYAWVSTVASGSVPFAGVRIRVSAGGFTHEGTAFVACAGVSR